MTSRLSLNALRAALAGFAVMASLSAFAAELPIPTQAQWADAKKMVKLASGRTLAYVEMGNGDGMPTLLIHGYTDNSRSWSLVAPYLKGRHIFAIDLRGHGKSDSPPCCYAVTDLADDASEFLDAVGVAKADVVGHSLGSMTGQLLAAQHPEKVNKLVLVSSTLSVGSGPGTWLWDNISTLKAPIDPDSQFMKDWYSNPNPVDEDYINRERAESAATPMQVWQGVLWGTAVIDLTRVAPLVKSPVMILWGDQDPLFGASHQARLKSAYPKARFETFAGAGHNMFWEQPAKAGELIEPFLDQ